MKKVALIIIVIIFLIIPAYNIIVTAGRGVFSFAQKSKETKGVEKIEDIVNEVSQPEFINPKDGHKLTGAVKIKIKVKDVLSSEFYLRRPESLTEIYLGKAISSGEQIWKFDWDTTNTPNGFYYLFSKITNQYGVYDNGKITVEVNNEIKREEEKETKLKQDIKKINEEVKKEEAVIAGKEMETKEKVVKEVEELTAKTKEVLEDEQKKSVEPEIVQNLEETKKEVKENIEKLVIQIKEDKKTENEIEEKEKQKAVLEVKISNTQKELEKVQKAEQRAPEGLEKAQAEIIKKTKKEIIESQKTEKEKTETEIASLKEKSNEGSKKKDELKKEIIEKSIETIKPVEKLISEEQKPELSKKKEEAKNNVTSLLQELEKVVKEKEESKAQKTQPITKDSDGDGLSDEEEIRIGTNPFNPDSDGDGFLDGDEYGSGYDPLRPGPTDKIIYQDPREVKPQKADIYKVNRVETVTLSSGEMGLKLEGGGPPDSFITLHIFSFPIIVAVKTDGNGYWEYTLDKPISDGQHNVYATVTNNKGEIGARSEIFVFTKVGEKIFRIFETPSAAAVSPIESLQKSFAILVIGIIVFGVGLALVIIGVLTKKKKED